MIVYFVCQHNTHTPTPTLLLKTSFALAVHCVWCVVENVLFQNHCCDDLWVLNLLGNQELNKHSQSTECPCLHGGCYSFQYHYSACLKGGLCPWYGSSIRYYHLIVAFLLWAHRGLFGSLRQPGQPSLLSAELLWFQRYMKTTQIKFSGDLVAVSAGLLQWMQRWLYGSLNRDTKVLSGMLVQCSFCFKNHWFLTWITQAWE